MVSEPALQDCPSQTCGAPAVRAASLGVVLDERPVLRELNLEIAPGELVALLGANGAGKSTLLRALSMLIAHEGRLELFGQEVTKDQPDLRRRIGLIAHQSMLYRDLSPRENLVFFGRLYGVDNPAGRADRLLGEIGLADRGDDPVRTLSRGMTQRVSIARALMHEPDLLLADEPFEGLDAPSTHSLQEWLARLAGAGRTVLFSTHDVGQGLALGRRMLVLRRGSLVVDQPTSALDGERILQELTTP
ncbi:MAG: Macrolide export ATP-binding/permease protein MacB [Planctomycetes bacterium ADurb.Bin126]|nr:MAG: Macrolide export ATP-binding/permease protein MacB [Planctomycetes bacterium ADurb.Bin126]HOD83071.1 ABC transporter ATP-binding protein [Phycisphaerae bacterium]